MEEEEKEAAPVRVISVDGVPAIAGDV